MKRELYSELRTFYEITAEDPDTFRISIKMKDAVDEEILRRAAERTMERYPYFRVLLTLRDGRPCFDDNPAPVPVIRSDKSITLGSAETDGHLLAFCCEGDCLYIDASHALTDGGGVAPMIKTLLYYYCAARYDAGLSSDGIRLAGEPVPPGEWEDAAARPLSPERCGLTKKRDAPALLLPESGRIRLTPDCVSYDLRIPENAFMGFNISNDGSPASVVALFLARSIDALHPDAERPPVIAMCVNQRKALNAPLAHQSLVGDVRLAYTERLKKMPFPAQATCFRGMVALQSDRDMVLDEIRDYQALMAELSAMDDLRERRSRCVRRKEDISRCITATVSYVGKADLGAAERYIREYGAYPSTALPSTHTPLTIELSAVNGFFFLNFMQYFREEDYLQAFIRELRSHEIECELLHVTETRWPGISLPWSL